MTDLAPILQGFFTDRLARQKKASPNTVAAYRDTCKLLLAFARHLQALDPATEVPPEDVLSRRQGRVPPYLYSPQEVAELMGAAGGLAPPLRAATWQTLIGLLAVTGMFSGGENRCKRGVFTDHPGRGMINHSLSPREAVAHVAGSHGSSV